VWPFLNARYTPVVRPGTRFALAAIVPAAPSVRLATRSESVPVSTLKSALAVAYRTCCWYTMSRLESLIPVTAGCSASLATTAGAMLILVNGGML
jgi:hypothetical protein